MWLLLYTVLMWPCGMMKMLVDEMAAWLRSAISTATVGVESVGEDLSGVSRNQSLKSHLENKSDAIQSSIRMSVSSYLLSLNREQMWWANLTETETKNIHLRALCYETNCKLHHALYCSSKIIFTAS